MTIIILLAASMILYVLSFFQKSAVHKVEQQLEHHSIQMMQEIYQLKKKIKSIEEEHTIPALDAQKPALSRDDVLSMYEEGYSVEDIADMTGKMTEDIEELLSH
ncbi:hypothetical protein [Salisediminibacterium selenitireducens]|nr:hypothetical protein [Salisediminibacterium selenitireducens]